MWSSLMRHRKTPPAGYCERISPMDGGQQATHNGRRQALVTGIRPPGRPESGIWADRRARQRRHIPPNFAWTPARGYRQGAAHLHEAGRATSHPNLSLSTSWRLPGHRGRGEQRGRATSERNLAERSLLKRPHHRLKSHRRGRLRRRPWAIGVGRTVLLLERF